jgi:hypothetical protein
MMKQYKSRTLIGRTLSRVKSRISSLSSSTASPNPLIAPPQIDSNVASPTCRSRAYHTLPQRSPGGKQSNNAQTTRHHLKPIGKSQPPNVDGATEDEEIDPGSCSNIARLEFKTSTWTVFGTYPKFPATAYVNLELTCNTRSTSTLGTTTPTPSAEPVEKLEQPGGYLYDLKITPGLSGAAVILKQYGHSARMKLENGERWMVVIHIGIRDTSLAARLSTSFKSLGGRLGRISNVDVINRWLEVLQKDSGSQSGSSEMKPTVHATVEFRHSLLPPTTTLREERRLEIAMTEQEMERATIEGLKIDDKTDEEDERVQESRVLGAPWL